MPLIKIHLNKIHFINAILILNMLTIVARKSYTMGQEINDGQQGLLRYIAEGKQAIVYRFGHLLVLKVPLSA